MHQLQENTLYTIYIAGLYYKLKFNNCNTFYIGNMNYFVDLVRTRRCIFYLKYIVLNTNNVEYFLCV